MKNIQATVWLLLLCLYTAAQQPYQRAIDSTRILIPKAKEDTVKGRLYGELAEYYLKANQPDSALHYALTAGTFFQSYQALYGKAKAGFVLGKVYLRINSLDKAAAAFADVRKEMEKDTAYLSKKLYAAATGNLATTYGRKGRPDQEMDMLLHLLPLFESLHDTASLAIALHNIATKFMNAGQLQKGYPYLVRNIALVRRTGPPENIASSYLTAASLMLQMDSLPQLNNYLQLAHATLQGLEKSNLWGLYYLYAAMYNSKKGNYPEATRLSDQAAAIIIDSKDRVNTYNVQTARMKIADAQHQYGKAADIARIIYNMGVTDSSAYYQLSALKDLYNFEGKAGHTGKSFAYMKQYVQLKDSMDQQQVRLRINELEQQYQASEKEKNILQLKDQNNHQKLALQQARFRQTIYLLSFLAMAAVAILLWLLFKGRQRISKQRQTLLEKELEKVQHSRQIDNYIAMLDGQEQERSRLARELHDGLGGRLATIKLHLSQRDQEGMLTAQLETAMKELRAIARNLMPETLSRFGLAEALKDFCQNLQQGGIDIIFQSFDINQDIPFPVQLMLYRIVQEAVANAVRHADAEQILVQCTQQENIIYITVEDNGKGFDPYVVKQGHGLQNITARVNHLHGLLDIKSGPAIGTIINIECKLT